MDQLTAAKIKLLEDLIEEMSHINFYGNYLPEDLLKDTIKKLRKEQLK